MKNICLLFAVLVAGFHARASHNLGANIRYEHLSGNSYNIIITTFTDVNSAPADRCELMVYFGDGDSATAQRINGSSNSLCGGTIMDGEVISTCLSQTVKKNIYSVAHTYAVTGTYLIQVEDPNRSAGICNINGGNSVNTSFHLRAELVINPFLGSNTSVDWLRAPLLCGYINNVAWYSPEVAEPGTDSLHFSFAVPMANGATVASYNLPDASTSFWINPETGLVGWDAPTSVCNYAFDIKVTEWKKLGSNYYYVGFTMQEVWAEIGTSTAIAETDKRIAVSVFPNPSVGIVNISTEGLNNDEAMSLSVYNAMGQLVRNVAQNGNTIVQLSDLPAGIYSYVLRYSGNRAVQGKFTVVGT